MSFKDFFKAVLTLNVRAMGVRAILTATIKLAHRRNKDDKASLERTLNCYDLAESIHVKAMAGDQLAFAELLALGTILSTMIAQVADQKSELVRPFAEVSIAWPIVQPYYESAEKKPQDRLRALGFGSRAKALGFRSIRNNFGLVALVLHCFGIIRKICAGEIQSLGDGTATREGAQRNWHESARANLDGSVDKLSNLPFPEVAELANWRSEPGTADERKGEVSGAVRYEIKQRFLDHSQQVHGWLLIAKEPKKP